MMRLILGIRLLECAVIASIANGRLHTTVAEDFLSMLRLARIALLAIAGNWMRRMRNERENFFDKDG